MKINVKIKNVLQNNLIYIIFVGFMIIKSIIFHQMLELKTSFSMIICLLGIPMLILLPALFIRKNYNKILYCQVIYSLISIILYGNYLYYQYATSFLSFYQIENLQYTEEIGMGLGYLIHISDLLIFFGDIIIGYSSIGI